MVSESAQVCSEAKTSLGVHRQACTTTDTRTFVLWHSCVTSCPGNFTWDSVDAHLIVQVWAHVSHLCCPVLGEVALHHIQKAL